MRYGGLARGRFRSLLVPAFTRVVIRSWRLTAAREASWRLQARHRPACPVAPGRKQPSQKYVRWLTAP